MSSKREVYMSGFEEKFGEEVQAEFVANIANVQRQLHAYIFSLVRHREDTEDVLQETNYVLWRRAETFTPGTNFRAWAYKVAQLQVMAYRKKKYKLNEREWLDSELIEALAEESLEEADYYELRYNALQTCLQALPHERRQLVSNRYAPGGCVNDMAEQLGKAPKAVSETLRRIRHALMKCIKEKTVTA